MPSKAPKSALATFRLSQKEYEESKRVSSGLGYRSFSEFARISILSKLRNAQHPQAAQPDARMDHFEQAVDEVCLLLRQIHAKILDWDVKKE